MAEKSDLSARTEPVPAEDGKAKRSSGARSSSRERKRSRSPPHRRRERSRSPGQAVADADRHKLYIGNLSFETTERYLDDTFSRYGRVVDVCIVKESGSARSRGFAFVTFDRPGDAEDAVRAMNEYVLEQMIEDSIVFWATAVPLMADASPWPLHACTVETTRNVRATMMRIAGAPRAAVIMVAAYATAATSVGTCTNVVEVQKVLGRDVPNVLLASASMNDQRHFA